MAAGSGPADGVPTQRRASGPSAAPGAAASGVIPWVAAAAVPRVRLPAGLSRVIGRWRRVPPRTVLHLDLTEPLRPEGGGPQGVLGQVLARGRPTLREVVHALERAAADDRVAGLFARVGGAELGLADVQELRDAVTAFRASGRPAVAHAETFGEFGPGNGAYYLASAFGEIHLQPSGGVGLVGVAVEVDFLRGALDKAGIEPQIDARQEYKSARDVFTETAFTPAHREASERIVTSVFDQLVAGVAAGRGLDEARVRELVDRAPIAADEALDAGLVDRLAYRDEAVDAVLSRAGDGAALLPLPLYHGPRERRRRRQVTTVALISGTGGVVQGRGRSLPGPFGSGPVLAADTVTAAFRQATADEDVKGILFRVDSPGGSYVASDAIHREVVRAREAGTPVVVSMGNVAGSGGYFVAMAADRIVAHPGTITGSIGVVAGKGVVAGLKGKVGLTTDAVAVGANAQLTSPSYPFTPGQWDVLRAWLDRVYTDFTSKAAHGRGMPLDRLEAVAKGRIWTGADALEHGLVDTLGGYAAALGAVRETLDLPGDAPLRLRPFPPRRSQIARLVARGSDDPAEQRGVRPAEASATGLAVSAVGALAGTARLVSAAANLAGRLNLAGVAEDTLRALGPLATGRDDGVLTIPDLPRLRW